MTLSYPIYLIHSMVGHRWQFGTGLAGALLAILIFFATGNTPASFAQSAGLSEYHVKAAFLYNFAKFVRWPETAFADESAPFNLCIIGVEPFIRARETLIDKRIRGHQVEVRRLDGVDSGMGCHMLFVGAEESATVGSLLPALGDHTLTVGESSDFIGRGGVINLKAIDNKVRFEIDRAGGERYGFKFSSQLLKLAILVGSER